MSIIEYIEYSLVVFFFLFFCLVSFSSPLPEWTCQPSSSYAWSSWTVHWRTTPGTSSILPTSRSGVRHAYQWTVPKRNSPLLWSGCWWIVDQTSKAQLAITTPQHGELARAHRSRKTLARHNKRASAGKSDRAEHHPGARARWHDWPGPWAGYTVGHRGSHRGDRGLGGKPHPYSRHWGLAAAGLWT